MAKQKTNKSLAKRLRITKNKKVIARTCGQDHFNAKESGNVKRAKRSDQNLASSSLTKSIKQRFVNR
ncbi:MAG: 50S ribosomal protein L35 [bacterium]